MKRILVLALPALLLGIAACDRPQSPQSADRSDPARGSIATRPSADVAPPATAAAQPSTMSEKDARTDTPSTDVALSEKVREAVLAEKGLNPRDLRISTQNGVVTLSGKVDEKSDQERMMLVAMSIDGVRSVVSNLVVDRPA